MSGESVVCRRTLEHSKFYYDVCCGAVDAVGDSHVRIFPTEGSKYLLWPFAVARRFGVLNRVERDPVMMSRVMPPNGHLAGWLIKKLHPQIKWIAYFSDPIWNSPFLRSPFHPNDSHRPNWLLMKVFGFPCRWALKQADVLLFNNERLAEYVLGQQYREYRSKVRIAPYGHEGVCPQHDVPTKDGKFRLSHIGQIYGDRTLRELVASAEQLKREDPELFRRLEIRLIGFVCEAEQDRVAQSSAKEAFVMMGQATYERSIQAMYEADCLLVIDPVFDTSRKNIYVPGKMYDYMSTGKPIICVCEKDSATADIARQAGCMIVRPSGDEVCRAIRRGLRGELIVDLQRYDRFCIKHQHENSLDRVIMDLLEQTEVGRGWESIQN